MQISSGKGNGKGSTDLNEAIQELIDDNQLHLCVECGKCSSICPMVNFYGEYVPNRCTRNVVEQLRFDTDFVRDEALWYCWACNECTFFCPSGVDFQSFMMALRQLLVSHGYKEEAHFCEICGAYMMPKKQLQCLKTTMDTKPNKELLHECPVCKKDKYNNVIHGLAKAGRLKFRPAP